MHEQRPRHTEVVERTRRIKQAARALGFAAVGVAAAAALDEEYERYRAWLDRGYHATMGWLDRNYEKRQDPRIILPGARSVVVVAQNYYTPYTHRSDTDTGKISRYAWGDDYHDVLPPKLHSLGRAIAEAVPGSEYKAYTDTGPILEKQWAVRAGIGWQGKHSNVISRSIGSWFFIGVVITTAELTADAPLADFCGTCTACIEACPTDAICEPYVVDANKCISYWTIETKAHVDIPDAIADNLDGWVYGCDICQDVCPWNRFQQSTDESRFLPRNGETSLELDTIRRYEQADFSSRFRKSPIKRPKMAGLKRNAAALDKAQAAGNRTHTAPSDEE